MHPLQDQLEKLFSESPSQKDAAEARRLFGDFRHALNRGEVRAAEKTAHGWVVNQWVKQGILLGFRLGELAEMGDPRVLSWVDKDTYPIRKFRVRDGVRIAPGGSSVRQGAYLAPGVVCMPPMYVNVGAYVDEGTMIDSHALIGSCAQIGKRVHVSAGTQIGGVLEPINALPVIVEDEVMLGGNCGVYEGTVVKRRAVLGTGTILNRSTPVYDLVRNTVHRATDDEPLVIPEQAVVVAGSRAVSSSPGKEWGISLYTPVIVKYRDEQTDTKIQLEDLLR